MATSGDFLPLDDCKIQPDRTGTQSGETDTQWSRTNKANADIHAEFKLPPGRPLNKSKL